MASTLDSASLNLKVGFEIHQQLATKNKLFCNCSCEEAKEYDSSFVRKLRPTQSELGAYDPAAMFEFSKMRTVEYQAAFGSSCLVEADEEPQDGERRKKYVQSMHSGESYQQAAGVAPRNSAEQPPIISCQEL